MAGRGLGLAGVVSSPTISSFDRSALTPGMRSVFDGLNKAGFGDVRVNSGYRSATANAKARGAKSSQHLTGNAADFSFGGQPNERKAAFVDAARGLGVNGLGFYGAGDSIHLDTRTGPRVAWGVAGSFRGAPPASFPGFIQPNISAFLDQPVAPLTAKPMTPPKSVIAGPVNAYAPEDPNVAPAAAPSARSRMPGRAAAPMSTGLGLPSVPAAPAQPGLLSEGGFLDRNKGAAMGGLLGLAAAGPVGGLLGGLLGNAISEGGKGTPSNAAKAALAAGWDGFSGMTSAQSNAARGAPAGGGSAAGGGLLGSIGGFLGGLFGGGAGSSSKVGSGGWGSSPNTSGNGGVSANMSGPSGIGKGKGGGGVSDGGKKK